MRHISMWINRSLLVLSQSKTYMYIARFKINTNFFLSNYECLIFHCYESIRKKLLMTMSSRSETFSAMSTIKLKSLSKKKIGIFMWSLKISLSLKYSTKWYFLRNKKEASITILFPYGFLHILQLYDSSIATQLFL